MMTFFNGLLMATKAGGVATTTDNVLLLLTGNGANDGTTFTDSSPYNRTITPFGAANTTTRINDPFGNNVGVMEFDGTNSGLLFANSSDFDYGADDFTIEFWLYNEGNPTDYARLYNPDGDDLDGVVIAVTPGYHMATFGTSNGTGWDAWAVGGVFDITTQWDHWALVRHGSTVKLYKNGVGELVTSSAPTLWHNTTATNLVIGGQQPTPHRTLQGCLSNYRITKGLARYTENFTPPTAAFSL
jgi:Concanavalin A-like lectin/glucanases superfamily